MDYTDMIPHWVYLLKINVTSKVNKVVYKIGISANIDNRCQALKAVNIPSSLVKNKGIIIHKIEVLDKVRYNNKLEAYNVEQYLLDKFKEFKYKGELLLPNGNSELITKEISLEVPACLDKTRAKVSKYNSISNVKLASIGWRPKSCILVS